MRASKLPRKRIDPMQVTPTSASTASAPAPASAASAAPTVDYNQFLQLLIAEMKNQDPTSPMDPTQSISQLASFSQVEQQVQTNSKLDAMLTSSALSQADSVIGHTLTSADGQVSGQVASVKLTSSGAVATLANGQTILLQSGVTVS
jgi:flagellar basal-body rod modification protein FlgD